jgi:peptidoglycan/xylan/chitin deacetylase (PgdA/CDA1 family)
MNTPFILGLFLFILFVGISWGYWFIRYGPRKGFPILLYHKIDRRMEWGGTWNTPRQFEKQLKSIKDEGYSVVPLEDLVETQLPITNHKLPISITFDDGYENIYHYAYPILKEYGLTATVFLITGFVGKENSWDVNMGWRRFRHLSWEEIHEMKGDGITFGSHTVTHRDLTKLPIDEVRMELSESKRFLEEKIGEEVRYLSYPFGRYTDEIQEIAKEVGYSKAFTSYPRTKNSHYDPFALGRIGIYIIDTLPEFRVKTLGGQAGMSIFLFGIEDIKGRVINFLSNGRLNHENTRD